MLHVLLLVLLLFLAGTLTCLVGNDYQLQDELSDISQKWFLNVAVPATCSGSINRYKVRFYENNLNDGNYDITLAVWKPITSNAYEKVSIL